MARSPGKAIPATLALAALALTGYAASAQAATYTVTTSNDAGPGSLRRALTQSGQQLNADRIEFAIPGAGLHTIAVASDLPPVTQDVTVDGYSQTGSNPPTATTPAAPTIAIDAANAARGIDIGGDRAEVRGLAVHSAQSVGMFVEGRKIIVAGNHVGTNAAGTALRPNGDFGVEIYGGDNMIGGPAAEDRNVIAGGGAINVRVRGGTGHTIEGNRIGTNATGTAGLDNLGAYGAMVDTGGNEVRGNLIAAEFVGLELLGDGNTVEGNLIGTNAAGTAAIPSGLGVNVEGGDDNLIGGTTAEAANVISGNAFGGLQIEAGDATDPEEEIGPGTGNDVKGNFVGTDATATIAIPNGVGFGLAGVAISISDHNTIGGSEPGAGNVIAANDGEGLFVVGTGAEENLVLGNWIGTTPAGAANLGNGKSGVRIVDASRNRIGETGANGSQNTIAHNGEDGVSVVQSVGTATGNAILRNGIFDNGSAFGDLAVDLAADGLTANDPLDADVGANALQNAPVITAAISGGGGKVTWTLNSAASTSYRLEFFASDACDASGSGEAQRFLGAATVVTGPTGQVGSGTPATVAAGEQVTMTATRLTAAGTPRETSEPSACATVT
jgi:hypothetical protein